MKKVSFVVIASLLLLIFNIEYCEAISEINAFNLLAEALVAALVFATIIYLNIKPSDEHKHINIGLMVLFISLFTDVLDEIYVSNPIISTIFEDLFEIIGFIILLLGINCGLIMKPKLKHNSMN